MQIRADTTLCTSAMCTVIYLAARVGIRVMARSIKDRVRNAIVRSPADSARADVGVVRAADDG